MHSKAEMFSRELQPGLIVVQEDSRVFVSHRNPCATGDVQMLDRVHLIGRAKVWEVTPAVPGGARLAAACDLLIPVPTHSRGST